MKLQWFIVYLLLGKQIVQFNVVLSEPNPSSSFILGPLLFLIFSYDAHSPLGHFKIITYADGTVILTSTSDIDAIQGNLSQDLDNLSKLTRFLIMNLSLI